MIWTLSQVALGGAVGAVARFVTVSGIARLAGTGFPLGTMVVNVAGSFLMGVLWIWLEARGLTRLAPLLMAGVLGGFTTFSAFSLDVLRLWDTGETLAAAGYAMGSVMLSVGALVAGATLMRGMV
ncbi:camphor resistance protein CrcB [Gemmobacter megaterium]|uniref:Fluoride-specific ion channel FluC n=1 Tax=Gemmobacter megaterium TaxID=1086013 RepID=A0A1N7LV21_9RHOB|nr:fluoride efflux transporter CrcB [Gemmobacter megaterium]GGE10494.1 putative fluoride ion transporter CrcB [Gemmobacter megaterium]SIS77624.1 camphor resistance protein CrcB [Gemmobacter megaterium]